MKPADGTVRIALNFDAGEEIGHVSETDLLEIIENTHSYLIILNFYVSSLKSVNFLISRDV